MKLKEYEATYTIVVTKTIQARNEEEAENIARDLDLRQVIADGEESQWVPDFDFIEEHRY